MLSKDDKQQPDSRTRAKILKKRSTKIECDIYQSKLEALTTGEKILNKNKKTKKQKQYPLLAESSFKIGDGGCLPGSGICKVLRAYIWRSVTKPFILLISAT